MKLGLEKRQRIAKIFGRIAEYTVSILILGGLIAGRVNFTIMFSGFILFLLFFIISVAAEPEKEV